MNSDARKRQVVEFFTWLVDGAQRQKALDMMTDDAVWWSGGTKRRTKADTAASFAASERFFKGPIKVTVKGMVAEGDRIAVESEGVADVVNGKRYQNAYHTLLVFRGDQICEVREYCDTKYAAETFSDLMGS
jgi:ketosteroid isomerase-like protein